MDQERKCNSVLVIEDDPDIRDTLRQILEFEHYAVQTAHNGKEGLDLLRSMGRPCLILLDLMMPVMNGWEFLSEKNGDILVAPIPVVVISAAGERAKDTPAHGYIKKPIDLDLLLSVVKRYCG